MRGKPHVVAVPFPAQGHVIPLIELVQYLVKHGARVTFVNTDFNQKRVINALSEKKDDIQNMIDLVSIPDGLEPWEDRNDLGKLSLSIFKVMPQKLEDLIVKMGIGARDDGVTCVIADESMGWALEVADKMGIKRAAFWPASAAMLACKFSIPKLISDGIINNDGTIIKHQKIKLSSTMPSMKTENLGWACIGELETQKIVFDIMSRTNKTVKLADYIICNSSVELEPAAFALYPEILPIGPLLASNRLATQAGYFWREDSTCLTWLDQQPACSVIYVAFGSFTVFDPRQFQELALGLELINRPFLWVVRPDMTDKANDAYPIGYVERIGARGRMVGWAPQQKVLAHPSIACFVSHCGWNSTLEGLSSGIPFLCWPYFGDQFVNQDYICNVWKNGLELNKNTEGIITREEIKNKVEQLLGNIVFKTRALELKATASTSIRTGGRSHKNLSEFIDWI